ncbi:hypothetical protein mRhiFer1_004222 [Rhinolophus ferrumequinum]|uniref:Homeobox domain-containing protein n=1 Tax=Rhinolophus ferrumequinum TaxID=59479 RepID=A0A7J7TCH0_RHIFE|nr:hypothetical protein mRhiFer1_004222 [Rhinolophus ferrumequinum]
MAQGNSPNKTTARHYRRSHTQFTEDQLKILIKGFNQKLYPGYSTKQKLALEINTEESRIQTWFQNRRARHRVQKRSEPEKDLEASQDQDLPEEKIHSRGDGPCRTSYTSSQLHTRSSQHLQTTFILGLISESNLLRKLGFQSQESKFGFKIKDLDSMSREKENLISP